MKKNPIYESLIDKSIGSMLSAIEIYNKPDFKYREETFAILAINSWELLLKAPEDVVKDVVKETEDVVKAKANVTKEFVKAQRQIYKLISQKPQINAMQMSENMGISLRQVQRYLKQLSDLKLIVREGGRKNGIWKILDEEYEGFFIRI